MTERDKRIAVAVLDGWNPEPEKSGTVVFYCDCLECGPSAKKPKWLYQHQLPDYLHSYDAIIPVIQKQPKKIRLSMSPISFMSTPAQLCELLLAATGKLR